jgi:tetratricopeptide (TPR) repeat protein
MKKAIALGLLWMLPGLAQAEWRAASSDHFVVYADETESELRNFSNQLERFHSAMGFVTGQQWPKPSPSNRVTIYVVDSVNRVRRLYGEPRSEVYAFYLPRAGGSMAVVPPISAGGRNLDFSMIALLHEYAHHFLISGSNFPMQRWFSEGAAEFFSSAAFSPDGSVDIGKAAQHRAWELLGGREVSARDVLDPDVYDKRFKNRVEGYYGRSWLLFHFLTFSKERSGQLNRYQALLAQGKGSLAAAEEAFGDLETLDKELDSYLRQPRLTMVRLPAARLQTGEVDVRKLSGGEAAIMPIRVQSKRGVDSEQASRLLPEARKVAARFPDEPLVLASLAEAELDVGNIDEAIAAADSAMAKDPGQVDAYIQKGMALFRLAAKDEDSKAAYARARAPFLALNQRENDHPLPLIYFYQSLVQGGVQPTPNAIEGLRKAVDVAPFDISLRMILSMQLIRDKALVEARRHLVPVAYHPHAGRASIIAQRLIARIDSDPNWDGSDLAELSKLEDQPSVEAR